MIARLVSALRGGAAEQALKKLRNRLLAVNLVSLSLVIAISFSIIYLNQYNRTQNDIRESLSSIPRGVIENVLLTQRSERGPLSETGGSSLYDGGASPSGGGFSPSGNEPPASEREPSFITGSTRGGVSITISGEPRIPVDYSKSFVVNIMSDGSSTVFSMLDMDEETYVGAIESVIMTGVASGDVNIAGRAWRYSLEPGTGPFSTYDYSIVFLDVEDTNRGLGALAASLFVIGAIAVGAILLISLLVANRAIRPVEESMSRQRRFVADASHELKTPIAVIAANAEAAAGAVLESYRAKAFGERPDRITSRNTGSDTGENAIEAVNAEAAAGAGEGPAISQWIGNIADEAARMSGLVENLLALAKAEEKQIDRAPFDLVTAAGEEADRVEAFLFEKSIVFDFKPQTAQTEQLIVNTDRAKMQAALSVLLENAVKYTPEGGRVTMALGRQAEKARSGAYISVSNTGAYIPAEDLTHIFDRFYRADPSRSSETGGHGIGLSIASEIAKSLGGALTATSVPRADGGAINTFTLTF